ncbi:metal-sulfur cluster biosynthetic enzyme [Rhodococcus sp. PvR044]|jgi:metal-sulfur cluster biosynthetic enzyme|uniref:metal-sulfur cluster assembly factor n=1 Tax=unclassified Rhodococcus (in: high G+C Gram-positive bacteria) TaxID=192944 RepID=UPI000BCBBFE6|nr:MULTISPECIES: metal-sulfur cluster assembly factor [unclassified Rhodococcus (in: high G+C Gram-positive bacteria)]MBP1158641.1 metal-sulfur cluster biosynthetic enzyme [Rhodococcus sp. PvR099]PTR45504.1 metal-sulfur cluster biosynthetic enzyme [Rhodococcus sp. OK611]SNX89054.1 Metal-sulfur cluster biosynthetic enzyme [Rhodococcus sp. OK270]
MTETQANTESTEDQAVQESAPAADEQAVIELTPDQQAVVDELEEAMRDVVDPELGINVVDLGLVYGISVDAEDVAIVDMTLTSAACPLTDVIEEQARGALVKSGLVNDLKINWVWMPPWGPDKITEDGRDQLRALGFTV